jgi:hypothetical protein
MRDSWLRGLAVVVLSVASFAGSYQISSASSAEDVTGALNLVESDTSFTVCAGGGPCPVPAADHTLFVFFSGRDCSISLFDTVVLDSLYRAQRGRLNVVGVAYDLTPAEVHAFAASSRIAYPIYAAPARLERFVHNPRPAVGNKPVKLLLSRDGRVLASYTSRTTVEWHHQDAARVLEALP